MPSPEALEVRKLLTKELVNQEKSLQTERQEWDDYAKSLPIHQDSGARPSTKVDGSTTSGIFAGLRRPLG